MPTVSKRAQKIRRIRRSERCAAYEPVLVTGIQTGGKDFEEETRTTVVSPYGAKITLCAQVKPKDRVKLKNLATHEEANCRVVRVEAKRGTRSEVALEFTRPSLQFWSNNDGKPKQDPR